MGWTLKEGSGTLAYSSGTAILTYGTGATAYQQDITVEVGKKYTITVLLVGGTSSVRQFYYNNNTDIGIPVHANAGVTQSVTITATQTNLKLFMRVGDRWHCYTTT